MGAVIGGVVLIGLVSVLTTTKESRAEARRKFARWNPLFVAIIIAGLTIIFWPWRVDY